MLNLLITAVLGFSIFSILISFNVKMQCERLDDLFKLLLAILKLFLPKAIILYASSAD